MASSRASFNNCSTCAFSSAVSWGDDFAVGVVGHLDLVVGHLVLDGFHLRRAEFGRELLQERMVHRQGVAFRRSISWRAAAAAPASAP